MNPDNPNLRSDAESNLIQKLESELAQAKEELTQVIKIGVEGQREINRKAHSENTKLKEALKVLRDAVEFLSENVERFTFYAGSNLKDSSVVFEEALKKCDEILEGK